MCVHLFVVIINLSVALYNNISVALFSNFSNLSVAFKFVQMPRKPKPGPPAPRSRGASHKGEKINQWDPNAMKAAMM